MIQNKNLVENVHIVIFRTILIRRYGKCSQFVFKIYEEEVLHGTPVIFLAGLSIPSLRDSQQLLNAVESQRLCV